MGSTRVEFPSTEVIPDLRTQSVVYHNGNGFYYKCNDYLSSLEKRMYSCIKEDCPVTATMGPCLGSPLVDSGIHNHPADMTYREKCILLHTLRHKFLEEETAIFLILQEVMSTMVKEEPDGSQDCSKYITIDEAETDLKSLQDDPLEYNDNTLKMQNDLHTPTFREMPSSEVTMSINTPPILQVETDSSHSLPVLNDHTAVVPGPSSHTPAPLNIEFVPVDMNVNEKDNSQSQCSINSDNEGGDFHSHPVRIDIISQNVNERKILMGSDVPKKTGKKWSEERKKSHGRKLKEAWSRRRENLRRIISSSSSHLLVKFAEDGIYHVCTSENVKCDTGEIGFVLVQNNGVFYRAKVIANGDEMHMEELKKEILEMSKNTEAGSDILSLPSSSLPQDNLLDLKHENLDVSYDDTPGAEKSVKENQVTQSVPQNTNALQDKRNCSRGKLPHGAAQPIRPKKKYYCPFCFSFKSKFGRHIFQTHSDEDEVKAISKLPVKDLKRIRGISRLRSRGSKIFNSHPNPPNLFLTTRTKIGTKKQNYIECCLCGSMYMKNTYYRHVKRCPNSLHLFAVNPPETKKYEFEVPVSKDVID